MKKEHRKSSRHHRSHSAALLMSAALAGCSTRPAAAAPADAADPIAVTIAPVVMTDVARAIDAGGVVQARTTATITARILAPVREVRAAPGDQTRKGQTLIVLDGDDLAAGARAARSAALGAEQGAKAAAAELLAAETGVALARVSHDRIAGLQAKPLLPRRNSMTPLRLCGPPTRASPVRPRGFAGRVGTRERPGRQRSGEHHRFLHDDCSALRRPDHREDGRARKHGITRHASSPPGRHSRVPTRGPRGRITHRPDSKRRQRPDCPRNGPTRSRARWRKSAGRWMRMRARSRQDRVAGCTLASDPANSRRRALWGRRDAH